jgi:ketosteroid isomerase-like protein
MQFASRDIPPAFSLLSPDIELKQSEELPWGGTYRGHDGEWEFFGRLTAQINSVVTIDRIITSAEWFAALARPIS